MEVMIRQRSANEALFPAPIKSLCEPSVSASGFKSGRSESLEIAFRQRSNLTIRLMIKILHYP